jgi:hypothetical protein
MKQLNICDREITIMAVLVVAGLLDDDRYTRIGPIAKTSGFPHPFAVHQFLKEVRDVLVAQRQRERVELPLSIPVTTATSS